MRTRPIVVALLLMLAVFGLVAGIALAFRHLNRPRIVAHAVAPDGSEFCVVQRCNWSGEPFTTSCFSKTPDGRWGWYYYDHEDWYWAFGRAEVNPAAKRISVYRGDNVTATYDWESKTFQLLRSDFPHRQLTEPQSLMPVGDRKSVV